MQRFVYSVAVAVCVIGSVASLSGQPQKGSDAVAGVDKARLSNVLDAWASMDVAKPAVFYAKDVGLAFYDLAPRKFTGWSEYAKGAAAMFKTAKSLTLKLGNDAQVHQAGNLAWATATVDGTMVGTDGTSLKIDARWTTVWEKRGNEWLIVHDHFSMPLPEPSPPKK